MAPANRISVRLPPTTSTADLMQELPLDQYVKMLRRLLRNADAAVTDVESIRLRAVVRERRSGRRQHTVVAPSVATHADAIIALIECGARHLRPRETQLLDDLVAGNMPKPAAPLRQPVRSHRKGGPVQ